MEDNYRVSNENLEKHKLAYPAAYSAIEAIKLFLQIVGEIVPGTYPDDIKEVSGLIIEFNDSSTQGDLILSLDLNLLQRIVSEIEPNQFEDI